MKNLFLKITPSVILLFFSFASIVAQNRYKIQYEGTRNSDCLADTYSVLLRRANSNISFFGQSDHQVLLIDKNASEGTSYNEDYILTTTENYEYVGKWSDGSNTGCTSVNNPGSSDPSPPYSESLLECTSTPFSFIWRGVEWSHRIAYKIETLASYNPSSSGLTLLSCEPLPVRVAPLCSSRYQVEYQFGSNTTSWSTALPYAQRGAVANLRFSDFPGLQPNENLRLRVRYNNSPPFEYSEDIITINTVECSPEVIDIQEQNASCSYSNDGGFILTFNRPLDSNERLVNLSYRTPGPNNNFEDLDDTTSDDVFFAVNPDIAENTGNQYIFPNQLSPGRYRFIYQSENTSSGNISSVQQTSDIIINGGTPLAYEVELLSDISCFDSNDGEIKITIDPQNNGSVGTPPYRYTLNAFGTSNFSGNSTTISNLGTGTLVIKVFDSENCTEKQ